VLPSEGIKSVLTVPKLVPIIVLLKERACLTHSGFLSLHVMSCSCTCSHLPPWVFSLQNCEQSKSLFFIYSRTSVILLCLENGEKHSVSPGWAEGGSSVTGAQSKIKWHSDRNAVTAHLPSFPSEPKPLAKIQRVQEPN
jgi:hypothetical protein